MSRIATGTGDKGTTSLFGGERVSKTHPRVEAYGSVDELNAFLGHAIEASHDDEVAKRFRKVQADLFAIGAELATPGDTRARIGEGDVAALDAAIDVLEANQPPLRTFILPGGGELASRLHVARVVCRRAERAVIALEAEVDVRDDVRVYLNRLSDLLFLSARQAGLDGEGEVEMDFDAYKVGE